MGTDDFLLVAALALVAGVATSITRDRDVNDLALTPAVLRVIALGCVTAMVTVIVTVVAL